MLPKMYSGSCHSGMDRVMNMLNTTLGKLTLTLTLELVLKLSCNCLRLACAWVSSVLRLSGLVAVGLVGVECSKGADGGLGGRLA